MRTCHFLQLTAAHCTNRGEYIAARDEVYVSVYAVGTLVRDVQVMLIRLDDCAVNAFRQYWSWSGSRKKLRAKSKGEQGEVVEWERARRCPRGSIGARMPCALLCETSVESVDTGGRGVVGRSS